MTTRFNELELAELEAYMPIRVMDRTVGPLLRRAPRLIAVARLANEQAERIAELEATLGCYRDGSDWPAGMREKFSEQENRLAERDATIAKQAERIAVQEWPCRSCRDEPEASGPCDCTHCPCIHDRNRQLAEQADTIRRLERIVVGVAPLPGPPAVIGAEQVRCLSCSNHISRLAERDATIERLEDRIAELEDCSEEVPDDHECLHANDCERAAQALYDVRDGLPNSLDELHVRVDELAGALSRYGATGCTDELTALLAERESTIERLTTEQADTATLFSSMTRRAAQMEDERDAAQDRLAAASVLLDRIFLDLGDVPDNWRALRAELDGR